MTGYMNAAGVEMAPIAHGGRHRGIDELVNVACTQFGWPSRLDPAVSEAESEQRAPCICLSTMVEAEDRNAAMLAHLGEVSETITSVAVRRSAPIQLLATVVEQQQGDQWLPAGFADHRGGYTGNLVGGPISGEDPALVVRDRQAMQLDHRIGHWLALVREAVAAATPEAKLFRYAQLLEIITRAIGPQPPVASVGDTAPVWRNGKSASNHVQARVWSLLEEVAAGHVNLPSLMPPGIADVWFGVRSIFGIRDAVAHHGGFAAGDPEQQAHPWFDDVSEMMQAVRAAEPLLDPRDHLARSARELVMLLIEYRIRQVIT